MHALFYAYQTKKEFALIYPNFRKSCCLKFYSLCQALKQLENAIVSSPLGLNPKADGERLIAVIPP